MDNMIDIGTFILPVQFLAAVADNDASSSPFSSSILTVSAAAAATRQRLTPPSSRCCCCCIYYSIIIPLVSSSSSPSFPCHSPVHHISVAATAVAAVVVFQYTYRRQSGSISTGSSRAVYCRLSEEWMFFQNKGQKTPSFSLSAEAVVYP